MQPWWSISTLRVWLWTAESPRRRLTKLLISAWWQKQIPCLTEKNRERCVGTTDSNFYGQRKKSRIVNTVRPCVQIWVRFGSPSRWRWIEPSTHEYLQASNVFVWHIGNGFVCWLSREFLFMNLFKNITFARNCCCWYTLYVTGCTHCIEKWKK